ADAGLDGGDVARQVDAAQRGLVDLSVALVEHLHAAVAGTEGGTAVADVMFGAGQDGERIGEVGGLESTDGGFAELLHHVRIFGIALIGTAPANVLRHGDTRRKRPLNAGGT